MNKIDSLCKTHKNKWLEEKSKQLLNNILECEFCKEQRKKMEIEQKEKWKKTFKKYEPKVEKEKCDLNKKCVEINGYFNFHWKFNRPKEEICDDCKNEMERVKKIRWK